MNPSLRIENAVSRKVQVADNYSIKKGSAVGLDTKRHVRPFDFGVDFCGFAAENGNAGDLIAIVHRGDVFLPLLGIKAEDLGFATIFARGAEIFTTTDLSNACSAVVGKLSVYGCVKMDV
jgi:hypothetical protein